MGKRPPYIAVETDLTKNEGLSVLAEICGYNVFEARGRLVRLWLWGADPRLTGAPSDSEGYAVDHGVVRRFIGERGVVGLLADGCDSLALGVQRSDGLVMLRGTERTVAGLRAMALGAQTGGRLRADSPKD